MTIPSILMLIAVICLFIAALGVNIRLGGLSWGWLGLALWALSILLGSGAIPGVAV